jgi:endonuclease/exonuclease/phosphatase family metal-dependent hydrolase
VVTTHLEYYSSRHREAQVERLRALHLEVFQNLQSPPPETDQGPFAPMPRPASAVLCGDFNFEPDEPPYTRLLAGMEGGAHSFRDAWRVMHAEKPHDPTCGVFDREQWDHPHCRDFFFVSADLAERVRLVEVNLETSASDHQPLRLVLDFKEQG